MSKIVVGSRVYWTDPDGGKCSGYGTVTDDDCFYTITKDDGGIVEAPWNELRLAGPHLRPDGTMSELDFNRAMSIALDTRKEVHYCREDGLWYWGDREYQDPSDWHGPFYSYFRALLDAVSPYIEEEASK